MEMSYVQDTVIAFGGAVTLTCSAGYSFESGATTADITCQTTGDWTTLTETCFNGKLTKLPEKVFTPVSGCSVASRPVDPPAANELSPAHATSVPVNDKLEYICNEGRRYTK